MKRKGSIYFSKKIPQDPAKALWQTYIIFSLTDPILIFPWYSPRRAVRSGWLSLGDIDSKGRHSYGPLDGENQARIVYAEYGPQDVEEDPLAGAIPGIIRRYLRDLLEINMLLIRCPVTASMWQPGVMPDWIVSYRGILRRDMQHPTGHAYIRIGDSSILRISVTI